MNALGEWVMAHPRATRLALFALAALCFEMGGRALALADDLKAIHSDVAKAASEALGG